MESEKLYEYIKEWPYLKVKRMYFDKDNLISDKKEIDEEKSTQSKRDRLIRHLFKIQEVKILYQTKMYNDFLRKTSYKITRNSDKTEIKAKVDKLVEMKGNTIEEVIEFANNSGLCIKDDKINNFINEEDYLYWRVKQIPYSEFEKLYSYLEGYVPLSTQHKIKGNEFHNVLVLLDSGGWTKYNFNYLFNPEFGQTLKPKERESFERVLLRTQKLFYVCCTRAKENLVVFFQEPSDEVKAKAIEWFGKDNIIDIDTYKKNEN
jgi:DNA helicase-2/ATP-dependent DNA helicase PcrA